MMALLTSALALLLASVPIYVNADISVLVGTWSSGSMKVQTGSGFANPAQVSFTYPNTSGISYSFAAKDSTTEGDPWYEIARYRFTSNGSQPNCITAAMNWVHGTYAEADNGSIILTPNGDGYQQIQDPCAAVSNFIENYNDTELLVNGYYTFTDATLGLALQLYSFDGSLLAPMYQVSSTPNMLPTQQLRNVTAATQVIQRRGNGVRSSPRTSTGFTLVPTAAVAVVILAIGSSLL
ncbi:chaperone for protein-folding within the ER, fungal-domain-containing protein [Lentinula aciculospora]|uniref:Chaperone for protein-folding within the ER, fungal-domain-containing protein n=1 Tax=Lentinula aciculospora TaxID=153920 RepID=A0A9W9DR68_9AGAR|nr:chaperone for protein-folding within the ER, fungal-domain-containing protein [Lentinula aciculospora]